MPFLTIGAVQCTLQDDVLPSSTIWYYYPVLLTGVLPSRTIWFLYTTTQYILLTGVDTQIYHQFQSASSSDQHSQLTTIL